ncbi:hypothetical protein EDD17DRAFT_1546269 [Pisolithus thermaeus]|nr:hypothetical protein EDD17DRAFT_1546269 [Pisolithus thermaeus]
MSKRPTLPSNDGALVRWSRSDSLLRNEMVISTSGNDHQKGLICSVKRTSNPEAPIISLSGARSGEIVSCRFDPTAQNITACSTDRSISLWRTYP